MCDPWFKHLFGGGQPQRRILKGRVTTDAQGNIILQPLNGQAHGISDEGSLDTFEPEFDAFLDCSCSVRSNQARFRCCEPGCGAVVCQRHIKYCEICAKGTCPQCTYPFELSPDLKISLCRFHYDEARRRRRWRRIARAALSPFIEFEDQEPPK